MPYLLIDDGFTDNPKITGLSDKAFRLHMSALVYCARNLTDGAISEIALGLLGANSQIARPKRLVSQLENAGLWVRNGHGWNIHDYLDYNPSRAELQEKRQLARDRKRKQRNKSQGTSRVTSRDLSRGSHATQDPPQRALKGSLEAEPLKGSPRQTALHEAHQLAATWATPDSDAFDQALDELEREHGISFRALERDQLWDIARTNTHTPAGQPDRPPAPWETNPDDDQHKAT